MKNPKISIITCTYNSEEYIGECIKSVIEQTYKNIEHIFIDGASSDNTLAIVKKFYLNPTVLSEPDKGIYDALNKGLKRASGDIIGLLHSDDIFFNKNCLKRVVRAFINNPNLDYYSATMLICDKKLNKYFAVLGAPPHRPTLKDRIYSSNYFAHPTYYLKREVIKRVGYYNTGYKIASDIDWLIRLEKFNLKYFFDNRPLIKFRSAGASARKYFLALHEEYKIKVKHEGFSLSLFLLYFYHLLRRAIRYFLEKIGFNFLINIVRQKLLRIQEVKQ